jgi:hypothetical protein
MRSLFLKVTSRNSFVGRVDWVVGPEAADRAEPSDDGASHGLPRVRRMSRSRFAIRRRHALIVISTQRIGDGQPAETSVTGDRSAPPDRQVHRTTRQTHLNGDPHA